MKVVVGGVDCGGKSRLLSVLIKLIEGRVNGTTSVTHENAIYTIETNTDDPTYAKKIELWEDSKNAEDRGLVPWVYRRIMKACVDVALICFPLDILAQDLDLGESLEMRISDMIACMEIVDRQCKSRRNPTVFLVGCRSDLLGPDAADPSRRKNALWHQYITQLVPEWGLHGYFECSASTGTGVGELLDAMMEATLRPPKRRIKLPKHMSIAGRRTRHCIIL
jgi:GTPase SAR1 family protein